MKRKIIKIGAFFGIFLLFLFFSFHTFFWIDRKQEKKLVSENQSITRFSKKDFSLLQEGDIILRRGYGFFSDIIAKRLNDSIFDVTHSGVLVLKNKEWHIIHSLSSDASDINGMQEQRLSEFLKYSVPNKILVVRPKNITQEQGKQIVERAQFYLSQKIPFDKYGIIDEPSEMYCTELIWQILETDLHFISLPKNEKERKDLFYSMKGTYDPKYFDIIINTYPKINK
ncbi:MAG: YiiX/YebB-like N1pC/P60 family cysteine hydrolase [Capnocytophaga sp.]|nr:YiiX/YebB-like N1pC/P60 family cysteine hydrolase [Capnocytophaga sp.]